MPPKSINLALGLDAPKEPVCAVTEAAFLPDSPEEWRQKQSDKNWHTLSKPKNKTIILKVHSAIHVTALTSMEILTYDHRAGGQASQGRRARMGCIYRPPALQLARQSAIPRTSERPLRRRSLRLPTRPSVLRRGIAEHRLDRHPEKLPVPQPPHSHARPVPVRPQKATRSTSRRVTTRRSLTFAAAAAFV